MAINILDSMVINRISAGEVVESPFSIVKELIDNSIDAGSTKIIIEIKNGGIDQISIKDNGKGIEHEDIIKAFLPHATSKIKNLEDLEEILTLGFRGEALASISNVSQTYLVSKTKTSDCAYKLEVSGGNFGEVEATISDDGTKIMAINNQFGFPVITGQSHKSINIDYQAFTIYYRIRDNIEACIELMSHDWSEAGVKAIDIYNGDNIRMFFKTPVTIDLATEKCSIGINNTSDANKANYFPSIGLYYDIDLSSEYWYPKAEMTYNWQNWYVYFLTLENKINKLTKTK